MYFSKELFTSNVHFLHYQKLLVLSDWLLTWCCIEVTSLFGKVCVHCLVLNSQADFAHHIVHSFVSMSLPSFFFFSFLSFALYFPCLLLLPFSLLLSQFLRVPSLVNPLYNVESRWQVFKALGFSLEDFCCMVWKANSILVQDLESLRSRLEWVLFVSAHFTCWI